MDVEEYRSQLEAKDAEVSRLGEAEPQPGTPEFGHYIAAWVDRMEFADRNAPKLEKEAEL